MYRVMEKSQVPAVANPFALQSLKQRASPGAESSYLFQFDAFHIQRIAVHREPQVGHAATTPNVFSRLGWPSNLQYQ